MRMRRKHNLEERLSACVSSGKLWEYSPDIDELKNYGLVYGEVNSVLPQNVNDIELEIGCGKGGFIIRKAITEPDKFFVAVESVGNVLVTACEEARKNDINNILFIRTNAKYLPKLLNRGIAKTIYLNFSCPYPKKSQANLRLTADTFLKVYDYLLATDGFISLKTDKPEFFTYSIEQLSAYGFVIRNVSLSLHDDPIGKNNIVTEYEKRFSDMGFPIYYLEAHRKI